MIIVLEIARYGTRGWQEKNNLKIKIREAPAIAGLPLLTGKGWSKVFYKDSTLTLQR
jgi:hypothetical protein